MREEWKRRFIAYMMEETNCEESHAEVEFLSMEDDIDFMGDDPEDIADGCIECWEE